MPRFARNSEGPEVTNWPPGTCNRTKLERVGWTIEADQAAAALEPVRTLALDDGNHLMVRALRIAGESDLSSGRSGQSGASEAVEVADHSGGAICGISQPMSGDTGRSGSAPDAGGDLRPAKANLRPDRENGGVAPRRG